jgi:hydroxymethylglutaryl-CoA lyase
MATDKLTGNMPTENIIHYLDQKGIETSINKELFAHSMLMTGEVFGFREDFKDHFTIDV